KELDSVIPDADKLATDFPTTSYYSEVLADALVHRAGATAGTAPDRAAADFERVLKLTRQLVDRYGSQPDHIGLRGSAFLGKGRLLAATGKSAEAAAEFDKAVRTFQVAADLDPDDFEHRRGLKEATAAAAARPTKP
ncbi:MAG TPA: hypothetical protein VGF55_30965, partial [Gemmataceae bacterium]